MKKVDEQKALLEQSHAIVLRDKFNELDDELDNSRDKLAQLSCPFEVGDKVKVCGYCHFGKTGIIKRVKRTDESNGTTLDLSSRWAVYGDVLKKDGSASTYRFYFTEKDFNLPSA